MPVTDAQLTWRNGQPHTFVRHRHGIKQWCIGFGGGEEVLLEYTSAQTISRRRMHQHLMERFRWSPTRAFRPSKSLGGYAAADATDHAPPEPANPQPVFPSLFSDRASVVARLNRIVALLGLLTLTILRSEEVAPLHICSARLDDRSWAGWRSIKRNLVHDGNQFRPYRGCKRMLIATQRLEWSPRCHTTSRSISDAATTSRKIIVTKPGRGALRRRWTDIVRGSCMPQQCGAPGRDVIRNSPDGALRPAAPGRPS